MFEMGGEGGSEMSGGEEGQGAGGVLTLEIWKNE